MLKGISPRISPELLKILAEMGHGDEIVFSDAHFPAHSTNPKVVRADGSLIVEMLEAVLPLFEIDTYVSDPIIMMAPVKGDTLDPNVENSYVNAIHSVYPKTPPINKIERFEFYDRAKQAYAVVITSDVAKYGNIILKKGVTPI